MPYRKKTLRNMSPQARKYARLCNDLESVLRRMKNYLPEVMKMSLDSSALDKMLAEGDNLETEEEA